MNKNIASVLVLILIIGFLPLELHANVKTSTDKPHPFRDLSEASAWAVPSLEEAIALGIVGGDIQGNINPKNNITRAEFVKILLIVMGEEPESTLSGMFIDVDKNAWYAYIVERAAKLGLVSGTGESLFLPHETLSRQDMAVIIARAYNLQGTLPTHLLDFDKTSDYAQTSVGAMLENVVMAGVGNDYFAPRSSVTREMAITTMIRLLGRHYIR